MAAKSKTTLTLENLEALGAERLAEIVLDMADRNPAVKRRLRLELAGSLSTAKAAAEIRKRFSTIERSGSFIDWDRAGSVAEDLDQQRKAILGLILPKDPSAAFDLMWRLMELADGLYDRCDDSNGELGSVFAVACADLGDIAVKIRPAPDVLAAQVMEALKNNAYGQYDGLIEVMAPALGESGLNRLKKLLRAWGEKPVPKTPKAARIVAGLGPQGVIYEDELNESHRRSTITIGLRDIAAAQNDVEAYVAQYTDAALGLPHVAVDIARRYLANDQPDAALAALDRVNSAKHEFFGLGEWTRQRLLTLEKLGRRDDAQAFRWQRFRESLDPGLLRAYLKKLPDFEDDEAERKALAHAQQFPSAQRGLAFLIDWGAIAAAAQMVLKRQGDFSRKKPSRLEAHAAKLETEAPLASLVLRRGLIRDVLDQGQSKDYPIAAQSLAGCREVGERLQSQGTELLPDPGSHTAFVAELRQRYSRKRSFWQAVERTSP